MNNTHSNREIEGAIRTRLEEETALKPGESRAFNVETNGHTLVLKQEMLQPLDMSPEAFFCRDRFRRLGFEKKLIECAADLIRHMNIENGNLRTHKRTHATVRAFLVTFCTHKSFLNQLNASEKTLAVIASALKDVGINLPEC